MEVEAEACRVEDERATLLDESAVALRRASDLYLQMAGSVGFAHGATSRNWLRWKGFHFPIGCKQLKR